ncbi:hypothetical protein BAUCODRAFT_46072, partial [Baudoinia panamericana UAMH 10762]
ETVSLRAYQREMLEASLCGNRIIMPTGSGKTLVAIARIRHELETSTPTKLIWFLANSVELCRQHLETLKLHLSAYPILSLTGEAGVDAWSEQRLWDAVLSDVRVVIGTPAVLKDALSHAFVRMSRLALLVFDEAHHCIKNHPMNAIMQHFYHPGNSHKEVPHILGLTASPAINAQYGSLTQLEANLDAFVATPKRSIEDLMRFVYPPHITIVQYPPTSILDYPASSELCAAVKRAVDEYDFLTDPYVAELGQYHDERSRRKLQKTVEKRTTSCYDEISKLNRCAEAVYDQLGVPSAEHFVNTCIERYITAAVSYGTTMLPDITSLERQHLVDLFRAFPARFPGRLLVSPKADRLLSLLAAYASPEVRAIVFVKERAVVTALVHLLRNAEQLRGHYSIGSFVGTSTFEGRSSLADLADPRQQQNDLLGFRRGDKNLIVATSVLEEGIDVSACNLVINFDQPDTFIAFLQRRGRARQENSRYFLLVSEDDTRASASKWQAEEAKMKREYESARAERAAAEAEDVQALNARSYRVESTGALLTINDAKAHLYHFCNTSVQANNYVDTEPDFYAVRGKDNAWTASVTLPSYVHPDVRSAASRDRWSSEAGAIKDAAFEAYVALHKAGLLTDNLLPLTEVHECEAFQGRSDQPSVVLAAPRESSWLRCARAMRGTDVQWHSAPLTMTSATEDESFDVTLFMPMPLEDSTVLELYWNETTTYLINISESQPVDVRDQHLPPLQARTKALLKTVHSSRMPVNNMSDFIMCFEPAEPLDTGSTSAAEWFSAVREANDDGLLIRVNSLGSRLYIFSRLATCTDAVTGEVRSRILAIRFPKRRDFLHPVQARQHSNQAYTKEESFALEDCTVEKTPLRSARFAAFIPSIMHQVDVRLTVQEMQHSSVLQDLQLKNGDLIQEAISAPSAAEKSDYNRLEYLGDALLKFWVSINVMVLHPTWPEKYLTMEKSRRVSNNTLAQAAHNLQLNRWILTKSFTGTKWRPIYASEVLRTDFSQPKQISSKTLADVVEALIGAAYLDGGYQNAYTCIRSLLKQCWSEHYLICSSLRGHMEQTAADQVSSDLGRFIGHHFRFPYLLIEALTHASLPFQRRMMSYERLEFLGDAVLDAIIVPYLCGNARKLKASEMHDIHEALVNEHFLGYCCLNAKIEQEYRTVEKTGDGHDVSTATRTLKLADFIRAGGQLLKAKQVAMANFDRYQDAVATALADGEEYPWPDLIAMNLPKAFSDVVESVLGALYIDTDGDMSVCEQFVAKLGIYKHMDIMLRSNMKVVPPKGRVGIMAGGERVEY